MIHIHIYIFDVSRNKWLDMTKNCFIFISKIDTGQIKSTSKIIRWISTKLLPNTPLDNFLSKGNYLTKISIFNFYSTTIYALSPILYNISYSLSLSLYIWYLRALQYLAWNKYCTIKKYYSEFHIILSVLCIDHQTIYTIKNCVITQVCLV